MVLLLLPAKAWVPLIQEQLNWEYRDSQGNIELQFGKSCLILESLKVNILKKITYGYRHWTCNISLESHLQYLVALCFENTKFNSYVRLSTLKTLFKVLSGSGFQVLQF